MSHKHTNSSVQHLPLQLDPGLPDGPPPGGKDRQQHICHADPQHWRPLVPSCTPCSPTTVWPITTPNTINTIKFADGTTVVGLITDNDETAYREESFKFLGVHITNKLSRSKHTKTIVKRAQQSLFPRRRLKRFGLGPQILKKFYSCTIESILTGCVTVCCGNRLASDRKALQLAVRTAQYITGAKVHIIQDICTRRCQGEAQKIVRDSRLSSLLSHSKWYRRAKSRSKRFLNSF
ncbi:unnamed protein product [Oncorhynchus mykiss]|uniref:Alkylated DNA repair protein AlkB homologue 8 N-terminal domain-containing protein n=1 Tax=Oncorhynchus mykiss TaxID=8022 RepID=A0A060Y597_ONCMY|nr:unnamed protein product [Oncorhynchus mykiss]